MPFTLFRYPTLHLSAANMIIECHPFYSTNGLAIIARWIWTMKQYANAALTGRTRRNFASAPATFLIYTKSLIYPKCLIYKV